MNARMFREDEIRGVADHEAVSGERLAEIRGLIDSHLAVARRVTA